MGEQYQAEQSAVAAAGENAANAESIAGLPEVHGSLPLITLTLTLILILTL